jgi:hypothetical protein
MDEAMTDFALSSEIELMADLITAASDATGRLCQQAIDGILGLPACPEAGLVQAAGLLEAAEPLEVPGARGATA